MGRNWRFGGALIAMACAVFGCGDDGARGSLPEPVFEVLTVGDQSFESGTLAAAGSAEQLQELWSRFYLSGSPPAVDFGSSVVVTITIPDDACPPRFDGFDSTAGGVLTPVFVEPVTMCRQPLIPKTFVVRLDRSDVEPEFTLRLPGYLEWFGEQLLRVTVNEDSVTTKLLTDPPMIETIPTTTAG